jgi:hypothetical protein
MPKRTSSGSTSTRSERRTNSTSFGIHHRAVKAWCCSHASTQVREGARLVEEHSADIDRIVAGVTPAA